MKRTSMENIYNSLTENSYYAKCLERNLSVTYKDPHIDKHVFTDFIVKHRKQSTCKYKKIDNDDFKKLMLYFYLLLPEEEADELRKRNVEIDKFCTEIRKSENNPRTYDRFIFDWWRRYRIENGIISSGKEVPSRPRPLPPRPLPIRTYNPSRLKNLEHEPDSTIEKNLSDEKLVKERALIQHIVADFSDDLRTDEIENLSKFTGLSIIAVQQIVRHNKVN